MLRPNVPKHHERHLRSGVAEKAGELALMGVPVLAVLAAQATHGEFQHVLDAQIASQVADGVTDVIAPLIGHPAATDLARGAGHLVADVTDRFATSIVQDGTERLLTRGIKKATGARLSRQQQVMADMAKSVTESGIDIAAGQAA